MAPYSICADNRTRKIVLTVRGTLSVKDALTDLSVSMDEMDDDDKVRDADIADCHQFVHKVSGWGPRPGEAAGAGGFKKFNDWTSPRIN